MTFEPAQDLLTPQSDSGNLEPLIHGGARARLVPQLYDPFSLKIPTVSLPPPLQAGVMATIHPFANDAVRLVFNNIGRSSLASMVLNSLKTLYNVYDI
jgi:hypothetical protein